MAATSLELGDIQLVNYICETCKQLNQFTPQLTIQCRFCGGHILSKPRTTDPKPIKMFGCDYRKTLEDLDFEELQAILAQPIEQRLPTSLVRLQKFKEAFVDDLYQQLIIVSPKAKKKSESNLRKFINNIFSSWHLTAAAKGQLNVNLFPTDSIIIQDDLTAKLKEPELPKVMSAVHVNFPAFDDLGPAPLLDFKATRTVNVQGRKTIVTSAQADRLVEMYAGDDDKIDLHVYYLYNLYSILGTKLCSIPSDAVASGFGDKPEAMDLLSTPLTGITARFKSHFPMEKEIWGSEGLSFDSKIMGGDSSPVYIIFTLDRNLSNQISGYLASQFARNVKNVDIIVVLPKKEENPFSVIEVFKKSTFYKKSKTVDSETHRLVDPDQKFCKPNKDDLVMIHLSNYESELKLGDFAKQWKNASE